MWHVGRTESSHRASALWLSFREYVITRCWVGGESRTAVKGEPRKATVVPHVSVVQETATIVRLGRPSLSDVFSIHLAAGTSSRKNDCSAYRIQKLVLWPQTPCCDGRFLFLYPFLAVPTVTFECVVNRLLVLQSALCYKCDAIVFWNGMPWNVIYISVSEKMLPPSSGQKSCAAECTRVPSPCQHEFSEFDVVLHFLFPSQYTCLWTHLRVIGRLFLLQFVGRNMKVKQSIRRPIQALRVPGGWGYQVSKTVGVWRW